MTSKGGKKKSGTHKQYPSFGAKICTDICPRAFSVPRSEHFSGEERSPEKTVNFAQFLFAEGLLSLR